MVHRDRQFLLGLAGLTLAVFALTLAGAPGDLLLLLPVLVVALPLLAGRYVGEDRIARLAAAFVVRRRRPSAACAPPSARRRPRVLARGGRLIADSLAVRPPPVPAGATA